MKRISIIILLAYLSFNSILQAQVTIGSGNKPLDGALLDLKEWENPKGKEGQANSNKGLKLPTITLESLSDLAIDPINPNTQIYEGMIVFHRIAEEDRCKRIPSGLYMWTGKSWKSLSAKAVKEKPTKEYPMTSFEGIDQPNTYMVHEACILKIPVSKAYEVWENKWLGDDFTTSVLVPQTIPTNLEARLIWKDDECDVIQDVNLVGKGRDAYIEIWADGTYGNAVVALGYTDNDNFKALWSWHIWSTPQPKEVEFNQYIWMDRNLGSTSAATNPDGLIDDPLSVGTQYQWGRKDPFPTLKSWDVSAQKEQIFDRQGSLVSIDVSYTATAEKENNLKFSVEKPLAFIKASTDWYHDGGNFWYDRWDASNTKKSVSDPCPEGWRVPTGRTEGANQWSHKYTPWDGLSKSQGVWSHGWNFKDDNFKLGYFPAGTIRLGTTGGLDSHFGRNGYYWESSTHTQYYASGLYFTENDVNNNISLRRSFAMSIRCVQDASRCIPADPSTRPTNIVSVENETINAIDQPNTYMVHEPSIVKIPVSKAYEVWEGRWFADDFVTPILTPKVIPDDLEARLIWKDVRCGLIQEVKLVGTGKDASIEVWVDQEYGNATVALGYVDNNDNNKFKALWSWHIWSTPKPKEVKFNHYVWMDRNLGSTSSATTTEDLINDPLAMGNHYQWGRKDPFPNKKNWGKLNREVVIYQLAGNETNINTSYTVSADTEKNIKFSVENPIAFIKADTDWYYNSGNFWHDRWDASNTKKSVSDPCPEGWRVPTGRAEQGNKWSHAFGPWEGLSKPEGDWKHGWNFNTRGYKLEYYPASGYRDGSNGTLSEDLGVNAFYWNASTKTNSYASSLFFTQESMDNLARRRSYAASVRCVQDGSFCKPIDPSKRPTHVVGIKNKNLDPIDQPNTYMVHEPSIVKIPVAKAYEVWDGKWLGDDLTNPVLTPKAIPSNLEARIIWKDKQCGLIQDIDLVGEGKDAHIEVWVDDNYGNAVVALGFEDDSDNNKFKALWSWHIWSTPKPQEKVYNNYTWMDRNLGSTSSAINSEDLVGDALSIGNHYQWGRKDPLPNKNDWDDLTKETVVYQGNGSEASMRQYNRVSDKEGNLRKSIEEPLTFIKSSGDWYDTANLWEDRWDGSNTKKSIADPCPEGWRVPSGRGMSSPFVPNFAPWQGLSKPSGEWQYGWNFIDPKYSAGYYPAGSYRNGGSGLLESNSIGARGFYWSGSSKASNNGFCLQFTSSSVSSQATSRAFAFSVRCVNDGSLFELADPSTRPTHIVEIQDKTTEDIKQPNTYMVHEPSIVKIPVAKAYEIWDGNWFGDDDVTPVLQPKAIPSDLEARLVWKDIQNGLVQEVKLVGTGRNAHIEVWIDENYGNAVVALGAVNATTKEFEALWSWHIWSTPKPNEHEFNEYIWMDRNLGSISSAKNSENLVDDPLSIGNHYQWGRKDPLPNNKEWDTPSPEVAVYKLGGDEVAIKQYKSSSANNEDNLIMSITSPLSLVKGNYDWYSGSSGKWGNRWDAANKGKAISDPCPEGWRVPSGRGGKGSLWDYENTPWENITKPTTSWQHGWDFENENKRIGYYPITGYRNGATASLSSSDTWGFNWSAMFNGSFASRLSFTESSVNSSTAYISYAFAVRCVKDKNLNLVRPEKPTKIVEIQDKTIEAIDQPNSYMVHEPSIVKIPVAKAYEVWNGKWLGDDFSTPLLSAKSIPNNLEARLLWKDVREGLIQEVELTGTGKNADINVWVDNKHGNAVVALGYIDANDHEFKALWSWHIWSTPEPKENDFNNYTWMDRNLGSKSSAVESEDLIDDPLSMGNLYQWGRKDPLPGARIWSTKAIEIAIFRLDGSEIHIGYNSGTNNNGDNLGLSINYPLSLIRLSNDDWYAKTNQWMDRWDASNTKKSVSDPCPEGWRVPIGKEQVGNAWSHKYHPWYGLKKPTTAWKHGWNFTDDSGNKVGYYPATGARYNNYGVLNTLSTMGHYWSASASSTSASAFSFDTGSLKTSASFRYCAMAIRCVKE